MDKMTASLVGGGILAAVGIVALLRPGTRVRIKTLFGQIWAESESPAPKAVPGGVKISGAEAKQGVTALSTGEGGVVLEKVKTGGKIDARHTPGAEPPKA